MSRIEKGKGHEEPSPPTPNVVGIGASAGGIDALQRFFSELDEDTGLAFVVIVHLAPDHKSDLPSILAKKINLPVTQVGDADSVPIEANHVYVIAPDRKLEISGRSIGASKFDQPRGRRTPIDEFFLSLAASHTDGFAVVLSGGGFDGALGARAIKEAGGLVLVQSPDDAAHDSMPLAVIETGVADIVAPAEELAARLAVLVRTKHKVTAVLGHAEDPPKLDEANEAAFCAVLEVLRSRTGHDFSKYKRSTIFRRMMRRIQLLHKEGFTDYHDYIIENAEEVQALFDDLLIGVTTFFRDPEAWSALRQKAIADLVETTDGDQPIRAWVPGCATGEEAYTLAILIREEIERVGRRRDFTVFATDIDPRALATAREGVYPRTIEADVSQSRLDQYFTLHHHHYRVKQGIRDHVVFAPHGLLRDPPFSKLNLISCRNLLIYLDRDLQEQVMAVFSYAAQNNGYLFLGASEHPDRAMFEVIDKKHRIFRVQKPTDGNRQPLPKALAMPRWSAAGAYEPFSPLVPQASRIHIEALENVAPPSLVVDEGGRILHLSNTAGRYLQQRGGPYARMVADAVRPELRDEAHLVLQRAFEETGAQLSPFVAVSFDGTARRVALLAQRYQQSESTGTYALLSFLEAAMPVGEDLAQNGDGGDDVVRDLRDRLRQAEAHLERMRDDKYSANEDLRAANEELQSLNEEYRSTTEELETSKEELQSVNEELHTVNSELKTNLEEISRARDDLENLMAATDIPTLFLSNDLRIYRFTPSFEKIFNVTSQDCGRPIGSFTHHLDYSTFEDDVRGVLAQLKPFEREVKSTRGQTFIVRTAPYQTSDETVDGLVVTFVDVTALTRAQDELQESLQEFRALIDASAQVVWTADQYGLHIEDSPSWHAFTGQEPGAHTWLDAVHPKDRSFAADAWREAVAKGTVLAIEFRVFHADSASYRWMSVRAVPLQSSNGGVRGWVGMQSDITERREVEEALRDADRRKDEFLAILGHELRNPIAAIRSSIESRALAKSDSSPEDGNWTVVDRQSRHMARLINDLLDIVRLDHGKLRLQREPIDLNDCISDVARGIEQKCAAAGLALAVDLADEPMVIQGDPERMVQILENLLQNSINFTDSGGHISVSARRDGEQVVVCIRDSGIGMDSAEIEGLFEPYKQVDPQKRNSGLGLGLTLVKRLVEMHRGTIRAQSAGVGHGSEFQVTFPLVAPKRERVTPDPRSMPPRRRILVVDDEPDVAQSFADLLAALGQDVLVANSGRAAIQTAKARAPDIAFLDLSMPGMGGDELARRLREDIPVGLHIVALSGFSVDSRSAAGDFDSHLLKPTSVDSIVDFLNALPIPAAD